MLVTFGRAATRRAARARPRAARHRRARRWPTRPAARASDDDVLVHLATGSRRRGRACDATGSRTRVADFDAATIATTHGFCQQMLAGLGIAGDVDPDADLHREHRRPAPPRWSTTSTCAPTADPTQPAAAVRPAPTRVTARRARRRRPAGAARAARTPSRAPRPTCGAGSPTAVRTEVERRKRSRRLIDYDDLLVAPARRAGRPGDRARRRGRRMRGRYRVVLVDEFQDTDPVQWEILRARLPRRTDPGAHRRPEAGDLRLPRRRRAHLPRRHRARPTHRRRSAPTGAATRPLLDALDAVLGGAALGDDRIVVHPVDGGASRARGCAGRRHAAAAAGRRARGRARRARRGAVGRPRCAPTSPRDVAADIVGLLGGGRDARRRGAGRAPVRPGDIAVLVRSNAQAALVRDALAARRGAGRAHRQRQRVRHSARAGLAARCSRRSSSRTAPAGCARGGADLLRRLDAARLAARRRRRARRPGARCTRGRELLAERGVAALLEALAAGTGSPRGCSRRRARRAAAHRPAAHRPGAARGGDRGDARPRRAGRVAAAPDRRGRPPTRTEERSRRLESDAAAVQVDHRARQQGAGVPGRLRAVRSGTGSCRDAPTPLPLHDDDGTPGARRRRPERPGYDARRGRHAAEEAGEDLRLLYVALTRAQCQVVAHWAPTEQHRDARRCTGCSSAHGPRRGDRPGVGDRRRRRRPCGARSTSSRAGRRRDRRRGGRPREQPAVRQPPAPATRVAGGATLRPGRSTRRGGGRRTPALTAGLHDRRTGAAGSASEAGGPGHRRRAGARRPDRIDRPRTAGTGDAAVADGRAARGRGVRHAGARGAGGRRLAAPTTCWRELSRRGRSGSRAGPRAGVPAAELAAALLPVAAHPAGPLAGGRRLADIAPRRPARRAGLRAAARRRRRPRPAPRWSAGSPTCCARHLPAGDPLRGYADDSPCRRSPSGALRGYLTGSIDAVLRVARRRTALPRRRLQDQPARRRRPP